MDIAIALRQIVADRELHALWLNSLSYLEYRGFRKIARSQRSGDVTLDVLMHAMEEVRHAIVFKRQALRVGGESFRAYTEETMLAGPAVKKYFDDLDAAVAHQLGDVNRDELARAAYCVITWLIESGL